MVASRYSGGAIPWHRQPNAWGAIVFAGGLSAIVFLELGKLAEYRAEQKRKATAQEVLAGQQRHETHYRGSPAATDIEAVFGTSAEDALLNRAAIESRESAEQLKELRALYYRKLRFAGVG